MSIRLAITLTLLIGAGCSKPAPPPPAEASGSRQPASPPAAPSPGPATSGEQPGNDTESDSTSTGAGNVTLSRPKSNESVRNPVRIEGTARTFENNVVLRLRNAAGTLIHEMATTATGEMGKFSPYSAEIYLTVDPGQRLTIEALELSAQDGSERSKASVTVAMNQERRPINLFFPNEEHAPNDCERAFSVTRNLPVTQSPARLAVEALLAGPSATELKAGFYSPFPRSAAVRSINLRDQHVIVDFNETLANVGGSCRAQAIRAAVTSTLSALPGVSRVSITAMGSEKLALQP